ncbi:MAG: chorismate synthase [Clostridiales bacterium]|nr:chorismate synthase [Clostridiales bacterium]
MSSVYGKNIKLSIFGQSHAPAVGVCIDGLPAGFAIDFDELNAFMMRRAPGRAAHATPRKESDEIEVLSGLNKDGLTCGTPLAALIRNTDTRPADYEQLKDIPRPSHADYTAYVKYGESHDIRGAGAFSGRLTAPLCIAGGICLQLLKSEGIDIAAHIAQIGDILDLTFDQVKADENNIRALREADFPVLSGLAKELMLEAIESAKKAGDSLGGIVECRATGVPAGLGDPMFDGMENSIASIIFGIPAVKGIEFGNGFDAAVLRGSQNNDAFYMDGNDVKTRTNNHGGILGGITSGMPLVFRVAFKPTSSIAIEQDSVSLSRREDAKLTIEGRHDPCIVPRAVPCVEAAAAIALYDALLDLNKNHP